MVCMDCLPTPANHETIMRVHCCTLKTGIAHTPEFQKKMLAMHAVSCGLTCGHYCLYCSTIAMLRCRKAFKELGEDPSGHGYSFSNGVRSGLSATAGCNCGIEIGPCRS